MIGLVLARPRWLAIGSLVCLLVASCDRPAEPVNGANSTYAPTAENGVVEAGKAARPAAEAVLTAEGYGSLRIGMTLAQVAAALGPDSDAEAVGGPEREFCDQFRPERAPEGLLVMIEDGVLTSISLVEGAQVTTDKQLRIGSTAAQVRSTYGAAIRAEAHKYQDPPAEYLTHWSRGEPASGQAAAASARGISYEIGSDGRVSSIHAGGPSIQYVEGCA